MLDPNKLGAFIVIEGVDGSGKSTQVKMLTQAMNAAGAPTHATHEPSSGDVGRMLRAILKNRLDDPPQWETLALLFAADRMDHLHREVLPKIADGIHVVSDRYYYSNLAYQTINAKGIGADPVIWIMQLNRKTYQPDITLILDPSPEVAEQRRKASGKSGEIYDDPALQQRLGEYYRQMPDLFAKETVVMINADRSEAEIHASVMEELRRHRVFPRE